MRLILALLALCACSDAGDGEADETNETGHASQAGPARPTTRASGSRALGERGERDLDLLGDGLSANRVEPWAPREMNLAKYMRTSPERAAIESDLELVLSPLEGDQTEDGTTPDLALHVFNRSETKTHPIVLSGDGSEMGWREPDLRMTVEVLENGKWVEAPREPSGRCGNFAANWEEDVVSLGPGQSAEMPWVRFPHVDLSAASELRVTAQYVYSAGEQGTRWRTPVTVPDALLGLPRFVLRSNPVVLQIRRPVRVGLGVRDLSRLERGVPVDRAVTIALDNVGSQPVSLRGSRVDLEVDLRDDNAIDARDAVYRTTVSVGRLVAEDTPLGPSRVASLSSLLPPPAWSDDERIDWTKVTRVRASVTINDEVDGGQRYRRIVSRWNSVRNGRPF